MKTRPLNETDLSELRNITVDKIKSFVQSRIKNDPSFKFQSPSVLVDMKKTTKLFFQYNHVCMSCGDVQEIGSYAIAQIAMGERINYKCECGHVLVLPQTV